MWPFPPYLLCVFAYGALSLFAYGALPLFAYGALPLFAYGEVRPISECCWAGRG